MTNMTDEQMHLWAIGYIKGVINCLYNQKTITTRLYNDMLANISLIDNTNHTKGEQND